MKTRTCGTVASGEPHTATTETDSQWLPKKDHPKDVPTVQEPWKPETADFLYDEALVAPLFSDRSCRDGVCVVSVRGNTAGSPQTAFAGLGREGRGEVRESTLTAEEK